MNEKTKKYHNLLISFFICFLILIRFCFFTKTSKYNLMACFLDLFKNPFFYIFTFFRFYKIMISPHGPETIKLRTYSLGQRFLTDGSLHVPGNGSL